MDVAGCASTLLHAPGGPLQQLPLPHPFGGGSPLFQTLSAPHRSRPAPRHLSDEEAGEVAYAFERLAGVGPSGDELVTPRQVRAAQHARGRPALQQRMPDPAAT